jgi:non-reducing end alpha-L-arabinofuranosidase
MAPITISGHKAYGVFIEPGMGLRDDDPTGTATGDEPEGMYWVIDGQHYNDGCCFDFGNAEIDSHDDGDGTMETSTSKLCPDLPNITSRFVTAVAQGEPHHWASLGGNAQAGALSTMFSGPRVDSTYDPMRKQGGIVLGNGGDNSNGAQGTFYEGVMTAGYPTNATDQKVQANIVAAKCDVQQLSLTPASQTATPPGLQTFAPQSSQDSTVTFTNTTGSTAAGVKLSISVPSRQWTSVIPGTTQTSETFGSVAPGASVSATFDVTSGPQPLNADLIGNASWTNPGDGWRQSATTAERVRDISPIKINEFRVGTGTNPTDAFVELYNVGDSPVDLSGWTLTEHPAQQPVSSTVTIPSGTTIAGHSFYLLGLANSGLETPASPSDTTINLNSSTGLAPGDQVEIGTGPDAETRTITQVANDSATGPRVPGKIGNALRLSGNGEYVDLPNGIVSGLTDFTSSAWVNPSANSPWSRLFDFGTGPNNFMFLTLSAGGGPLTFSDTTPSGAGDTIAGTGTLPLNTWSHVAVTLSGHTGTLYVDGQPVATDTNMNVTPIALDSSGNGRNATIIGVGNVSTPLWQPLPDEPITVPAGSTNVPVTSTSGFSVGQKMTIGYGRTLDTATVTAVSTPGTQDYLAAAAPAGATNLEVTSTSNITAGDRIRLDIGTRTETVTVLSVGTAGADGTGLTLTAPLKFDHAANLPFSDRGTGISFSPATRFAHSSNEPVQALGSSITLNNPLGHSYAINDPVLDVADTSVGYQGPPAPDQWFGGPALSASSGSMVLRDAEGLEADSLNYGAIVDPSAAEGYQGTSGTGAAGCFAPTPIPANGVDRSDIRLPDGNDTDSNCADFTVTNNPTPGGPNEGIPVAGP